MRSVLFRFDREAQNDRSTYGTVALGAVSVVESSNPIIPLARDRA